MAFEIINEDVEIDLMEGLHDDVEIDLMEDTLEDSKNEEIRGYFLKDVNQSTVYLTETTAAAPVLKSSAQWCSELGVMILDADGWNRRDFENSWGELITQEEFEDRAAMSTQGF